MLYIHAFQLKRIFVMHIPGKCFALVSMDKQYIYFTHQYSIKYVKSIQSFVNKKKAKYFMINALFAMSTNNLNLV